MSDAERIERLEKTLATLISWMFGTLGADHINGLLEMLTEGNPQEQPQ